jgi:hypothetical protein
VFDSWVSDFRSFLNSQGYLLWSEGKFQKPTGKNIGS